MKEKLINWLIKILKPQTNKISDGYHTFEQLYEHRIWLWIKLCQQLAPYAWRSKKHSDGTSFEGWFVLGLDKVKGQQKTYHLPLSVWKDCGFAETLNKAPDFDYHSTDQVLERIKNL